MIQRGGEVVIRMLENVQQRTIEPLIKAMYLSFFEFVHNASRRGKALLSALLQSLLASPPRNTY